MKKWGESEERSKDMKSFITTFLMCYVLLYILMFFGFGLIYDNIWAILGVISLAVAAVIEGFTAMEKKIEKLEKRIEELEGKKEDETENIDG